MKIYDSHCHPNIEPLSKRVGEILKDAQENDMHLNVVGVDIKSSYEALKLARANPQYFSACIAIHPNDVQFFDLPDSRKQLELMCVDYKKEIVAIGECGLDFHYSIEHKQLQYKFLEMQLEIALKFQLPLMLHVRDAHLEMIDFLKLHKPNVPIIFHCFSENSIIATKILELSKTLKIYFSIPGIVTYKNAKELQQAVELIPLDLMLVETDSPWLAPDPYRGKDNKPLYVVETIKKIALLKNKTYDQVEMLTCTNANDLFLKKR